MTAASPLRAPATAPTPRRGEIYWLDFSPATGAEMRGLHPALVLQNDVANRASALTIVATFTSNLRAAELPVGVLIEPAESGLPLRSVAHLGHLYTVDKRRLRERVGVLPQAIMARVERALLVSFGMDRPLPGGAKPAGT